MASKVSNYAVAKGDVIWVQYRRNPLWPALVQNVYAKKITYVFFPLPTESGKKWTSFSCHPKSIYAFCTNDLVPDDATQDLLQAFASAHKYLTDKGRVTGSQVQPRVVEKGMSQLDSSKLEELLEAAAKQSSDIPTHPIKEHSVSPKPPPSVDKVPVSIKTSVSGKRGRKPLKRNMELVTGPPVEDVPDENILHLGALKQIIFNRLEDFLTALWCSDRVRNYATPPRSDIKISLQSARFLSDDDADILFEKVVKWVRNRESDCRILPAMHLTSKILFPEIIILAIQQLRNITYDESFEYVYTCSESRAPQSGLEELVRVACQER